MRVRILPYKIGSESAKLLAQSLGVLRCNPYNTRFRPREDDLIINWGCSCSPRSWWSIPTYWHTTLNPHEKVAVAADKIAALIAMQDAEVSVIPFTTGLSEAKNWQQADDIIYERHTVTGHGGQGIKVVQPSEELSIAPLYTKGIKIRREYRVHVFNGEVIDHVQKRRRFNSMDVSPYIRNHSCGWVFVREGFDRLDEVESQAKRAVEALGLDFGAVDIITEACTGTVYVLEVNTACGMQGTTLQKYTEAIRGYINARS